MKKQVLKYTVSVATVISVAFGIFTGSYAYNGWADGYMNYCVSKGIISGDENGDLMPDENLTREQMVKIIMNTSGINIWDASRSEYADVSPERWSYPYISKYQEYVDNGSKYFHPEENVTREEFLAMSIKLSVYGNYKSVIDKSFRYKIKDWKDIDEKYYEYIKTGFEKGCIEGSDGHLRPKDLLTRAEACAMVYKLSAAIEKNKLSDAYFDSLNKPQEPEKPQKPQKPNNPRPGENTSVPDGKQTNLMGESEATLDQAKQWAKNRGAHQRFIDIADLYWKYAELTGIRADVMYAQAAKETNFGKYTGQVRPEQNNWAGIKKYGAQGDDPDDHETFATPEDGVRGHFNHMSAYIGLEPIGEPHGRYKSVKSLSWAGTVKTVEQLGGKWCPNPDYGKSIMRDYVEPMKNTKVGN